MATWIGVALCLLVGYSTAANHRSSTMTSMSTQRTTTYSPRTKYWYMDDLATCLSSGTQEMAYESTKEIVRAFRGSPHYVPSSSCVYTFVAYGSDKLTYYFGGGSSQNYIRDCGITVNIYSGGSVYTQRQATYTCYDVLPSYTQYLGSQYITVEIKRDLSHTSPQYNFQIYIKNHSAGGSVVGWIFAVTFGAIGFFIFIIVLSVCCCVRRRRRLQNDILRAPLVVDTSSYPRGNSTYPTGPQPYPGNNYGAAGTQNAYQPAPGFSYPTADGNAYQPPPAGGAYLPPPAGSAYPPPPAAGPMPPPYYGKDQPPPPTYGDATQQ